MWNIGAFLLKDTLSEYARLESMLTFEKHLMKKGFYRIAGLDEAGRGPLAGPVVAAACILPQNYKLLGLDDSKKLSKKLRESLYFQLIENPEVIFAIGIVEPQVIDQLNIHKSSLYAMKKALEQLKIRPDYLLIDGPHKISSSIKMKPIIKGDSISLSIAAASVIAKYTRDAIMDEAHLCYPLYGFDQNRGYPTKKHLEALKEHGPSEIHRFSFSPLKNLSQ